MNNINVTIQDAQFSVKPENLNTILIVSTKGQANYVLQKSTLLLNLNGAISKTYLSQLDQDGNIILPEFVATVGFANTTNLAANLTNLITAGNKS